MLFVGWSRCSSDSLAVGFEPRRLLRRIALCLSEADVPFMLTGSLAAAFYGTPRATQDIDLVVNPSRPQLDRLVAVSVGHMSDQLLASR
jgi:hypothetical protein